MRLLATVLMLAMAVETARADEKAAEIVKSAIKATGGAELLDKFKGGMMKMKGDLNVQGLEMQLEGEVTYMLPDKFKMKLNISVMGLQLAIEQVLNGKKMKSTLNGMEMPLDDNSREQMEDSLMDQEVTQLTPLLDPKRFKLSMGDATDVDGKKVNVVMAERLGDTSKLIKLGFDQESKLLVMMQRKSKDDLGAEVDEASYFSDYKEVQGVKVSHRGSVKRDGKEFMKFELSSVKLMEKIEDKEFSVDD